VSRRSSTRPANQLEPPRCTAEVWRQIFAAAVRPCVHAQRVQTIGDDDDDPFNLAHPQHLRGSLKTNLALCLVSKSFNSLATEFLYECIHFTSYNGLNPAIRLSTREVANKFWWTKVLSLRFWLIMDNVAASVAHLLSKCVNLRLLVFEMGPSVGLDQVEPVYRSIPRSVRAISWNMVDSPLYQHTPTAVLDNISQLSIDSRTMMPTPALTLPRLTYFRAMDMFAPTSLTLPALRTVCMVAWRRNKKLESSPLGLFIQSYAKQITALQIESGGSFEVDFPVPLIYCCTNLEMLKYDPFLIRIRNPPQSIDRDAVQHTKLTHVHLVYCPDVVLIMSLAEPWKANYTWLLNGGFPALEHIIVLRSGVVGIFEGSVLDQVVTILRAWVDPRVTLIYKPSVCT